MPTHSLEYSFTPSKSARPVPVQAEFLAHKLNCFIPFLYQEFRVSNLFSLFISVHQNVDPYDTKNVN